MPILLLSILIFSSSIFAQEMLLNGYDAKRDQISSKYEAGAFLIYDCKEGHWVCVLEEFYEVCEKERAEGILQNELQLSCAPVGEFLNKKSCFQRQLFLTSQAHGSRICVSDSWKQKEISY